jgi:acetyltransferase-like isoleucine patch superfamily enzyme
MSRKSNDTGIDLPPSSKIVCQDIQVGENVLIGPDVHIECERLLLGNDVFIGCQTNADFRAVAGVRIHVRELDLGDHVTIGRCVRIRGGSIHLGKGVRIKDWNDVHVKRRLYIDAGGIVNEHCEIGGVDIQFGRELWMLPYTKIGGGNAFEVQSSLKAGHFVHLGMYSFINTARSVTLGDEVGLGTHTALYTHGAYPSELRGAPAAFGEIHIGDRSWLPGAIVNPGVTIGQDCVIGVGSVVTRNIPDGALAVGAPCKVIRENAYPRELLPEQRRAKIKAFLRDFAVVCSDHNTVQFDEIALEILLNDLVLIVYREILNFSTLADLRAREPQRLLILTFDKCPDSANSSETFIDLKHRDIDGLADPVSERLLNQLRRYGTRFRYQSRGDTYQSWNKIQS